MPPEVESGIPVPEIRAERNQAARARNMKDGDSVLFASWPEARSFYRTLFRANEGTRFKRIVRRVEGGWRVWRKLKRR